MIRQPILITSLAAVLAAGLSVGFTERDASAPAERPVAGKSRAYLHSFNLPAHGVALEGYSPVSYFEGRAERGNPLFAVEHRGVTYHLTGADQVAAFKRNPSRYEPAFGGWCAFGMAVSDKFPVDPTLYKIVNDRLLLFLRNPGVDALQLWNKDSEAELMKKAEAHWKKVSG